MAKKHSSKPAADTSTATAENEAAVTVRVLCAALGEDSVTYLNGETFTTTASRAAALGSSIETLS